MSKKVRMMALSVLLASGGVCFGVLYFQGDDNGGPVPVNTAPEMRVSTELPLQYAQQMQQPVAEWAKKNVHQPEKTPEIVAWLEQSGVSASLGIWSAFAGEYNGEGAAYAEYHLLDKSALQLLIGQGDQKAAYYYALHADTPDDKAEAILESLVLSNQQSYTAFELAQHAEAKAAKNDRNFVPLIDRLKQHNNVILSTSDLDYLKWTVTAAKMGDPFAKLHYEEEIAPWLSSAQSKQVVDLLNQHWASLDQKRKALGLVPMQTAVPSADVIHYAQFLLEQEVVAAEADAIANPAS